MTFLLKNLGRTPLHQGGQIHEFNKHFLIQLLQTLGVTPSIRPHHSAEPPHVEPSRTRVELPLVLRGPLHPAQPLVLAAVAHRGAPEHAIERREARIGAEGPVVAAEGGPNVDDVEGPGLEALGRGAELEGAVLVSVHVRGHVLGGGGGEEEEDARGEEGGWVGGVWVLDLGGELGERGEGGGHRELAHGGAEGGAAPPGEPPEEGGALLVGAEGGGEDRAGGVVEGGGGEEAGDGGEEGGGGGGGRVVGEGWGEVGDVAEEEAVDGGGGGGEALHEGG